MTDERLISEGLKKRAVELQENLDEIKERCGTDEELKKRFAEIEEHLKSNHRKPTNEQMAELYEAIAIAMDKPGMNDPIYYLGNRTLADCFFEEGYTIELADLPERVDGHYHGRRSYYNGRRREGKSDQIMVNLNWWPTMTLDRRVEIILHEIAHFDVAYDDNIHSGGEGGPPSLCYLEYKAQIRGYNLQHSDQDEVYVK